LEWLAVLACYTGEIYQQTISAVGGPSPYPSSADYSILNDCTESLEKYSCLKQLRNVHIPLTACTGNKLLVAADERTVMTSCSKQFVMLKDKTAF
jgi:hypothetical protein